MAGDTFDYSLDREYLYASIIDAMGHGTEAALLATLVMASLRNSRRSTATPAAQAHQANRMLLDQANPDQFVTGQLLSIRLADGLLRFVNAGHPGPFLMRNGVQIDVDMPVNPALGILPGDYDTLELHLQPGDRLLLVTDGFLERKAAAVDIGDILVRSGDRHPREVVRELAENVMQVTGGVLKDDATVVCIDWYGSEAVRVGLAGASQERATGKE